MSYFDIYKLRLNRYGLNYQERVQTEREKLFELYLLKSTYRIDFNYKNQTYPASFEKYKQDETETLHYLLTSLDLNMPNGTILYLPDKNNKNIPWMVYYLESIVASGYNRYIMLKMTHIIKWQARDGRWYYSVAYLYGQENNMLKDELQSRSRSDAVYKENLKSSFLILPCNPLIHKDDYLIIGTPPLQEHYRVTGYDIQSSIGVEYVTIDPTYEHDLSMAPVQLSEDNSEDFYWLTGGGFN